MMKIINDIKEINKSFDKKKILESLNLEKEYEYYTTNVSNKNMAVSLTCCSYLLHLINYFEPESVLDLGSGFSSFALRKYNKVFNKKLLIRSVDSDKIWLNKTKQYCKDKDLSSEGFFTWNRVESFNDFYKVGNMDTARFDLIFFDIDLTKNRPTYYKPVLKDLTKENTVILFDDMHKISLFDALIRELNNFKHYKFYDTEQITKFEKRFSHLVQIGRH